MFRLNEYIKERIIYIAAIKTIQRLQVIYRFRTSRPNLQGKENTYKRRVLSPFAIGPSLGASMVATITIGWCVCGVVHHDLSRQVDVLDICPVYLIVNNFLVQ
jgi:hypothetical protein